jgi:hypothetical protein
MVLETIKEIENLVEKILLGETPSQQKNAVAVLDNLRINSDTQNDENHINRKLSVIEEEADRSNNETFKLSDSPGVRGILEEAARIDERKLRNIHRNFRFETFRLLLKG